MTRQCQHRYSHNSADGKSKHNKGERHRGIMRPMPARANWLWSNALDGGVGGCRSDDLTLGRAPSAAIYRKLFAVDECSRD
jgi:hypothetical protein